MNEILKAFSRRPWLGSLLALVAVYGLFLGLTPQTFGRAQNLVTMARQMSALGVVASGMTLVMILGGVDLSVGSAVALTTVVIASALKSGLGPMAAVGLGVGAAALAGAVNGGLIAKLSLRPFIVTLGAMSILRGVAKGVAHEQKIDTDARGLDSLVSHGGALGLPPAIFVLAAVALAVAFALGLSRFGRHVVAIGSNEETARLAGVSVARVKILVYTLCGALAGVAGILEFATLTVGDPTDSSGLELDAIASVVIGGGSLAGGEGSVLGSILGALLMTVIKTGCTHLGLPNWVEQITAGAIIVVAAIIDRVRRRAL